MQPGSEPRSPRLLANTLLIKPMSQSEKQSPFKEHEQIYKTWIVNKARMIKKWITTNEDVRIKRPKQNAWQSWPYNLKS